MLQPSLGAQLRLGAKGSCAPVEHGSTGKKRKRGLRTPKVIPSPTTPQTVNIKESKRGVSI
jgi:hypothetical protein